MPDDSIGPTVLRPGDPAPWFTAATPDNPRFVFDSVAGRYVVLCFHGSTADARSAGVLQAVVEQRACFDDVHATFFSVSVDPEDQRSGRVQQLLPGLRPFWDFDARISRLYGRLRSGAYEPMSFVLDERLRVYAMLGFGMAPQQHVQQLLAILATAPDLRRVPSTDTNAPVLVLPRVFEPALCRRLMAYYDEGGAYESGFMREVEGKTVGLLDARHKRRSDKELADEPLRRTCMERINSRVVPEIQRAFQFKATRIERHIVACYDSSSGGHFRAHRDNTTKGTAHRRFAVSVVLNSGEFEGGELRFPEFGWRTYSPPAGGAVVFSCSLLHEATPVTAGRRFCYLPFLYDEEAARVRAANEVYLAGTPKD